MPYDPLAAPTKLENVTRRADHSSICPVCHIYIARNWSLIARLPELLPIHCRDRNGNPGRECDDSTRSGYPRSHRITESAWVHVRCYGVGLKLVALLNTEAIKALRDHRNGPALEPALNEIRALLMSARPPGTITWGDEEDWAADHD